MTEGLRPLSEVLSGVIDVLALKLLENAEVAPVGAHHHPVASDGEGAQHVCAANGKPAAQHIEPMGDF